VNTHASPARLAERRPPPGRRVRWGLSPFHAVALLVAWLVQAELTAEENGRILVRCDRLTLAVEPDRGTWHVTWNGPHAATIASAQFAVEVAGRTPTAAAPQSSVGPFQDALGKGREVRQVWEQDGFRVEREVRAYDAGGAVTLGGRLVNGTGQAVSLGTVKLLELGKDGRWQLGAGNELPGAVYLQGHSLLRTVPYGEMADPGKPAERSYRSSGVLALARRGPPSSLVLGYLSANEAAPDLAAQFRAVEGGVSLSASSRFLGRVLGPGDTVEFDRLYMAAESDVLGALEAYGEAVAKFSPQSVRTGATSLWCSWYAHRMSMTEESVLANAAVAGQHLQPLGLEIMQLDHGWQRGDITGDWYANERFPHGLRWLADRLRERHGLRLGLWIAPTDVAETSDLFRQHPDWLLKDDRGQPRVNWRWYWAPNPNCYELDVTQPEAYRHTAATFRRLVQEGATYFKIDFIAAAGGEQFHQADSQATRGWSNLRRAMQAIREGAGDSAWIRYCQTPPLLSVGLANSAYGGDDTLDAGIPGRFDVLRDNAHALAAGWWLNGRLYQREVCDMSVRMQGSLEEVRVRAALMTLANCSISWSDELRYLPPSRLRLMQQCLPPGNPPMRPRDLLEREVPSLWHVKVPHETAAWDVVGVFNHRSEPEVREVDFQPLGLEPNRDYTAFEFWEERFLGVLQNRLTLALPPQACRILALRPRLDRGQLVGTDMHLLQGWHELVRLDWNPADRMLAGTYRRAAGMRGKAFFLVPVGFYPRFDFPLSPTSARLTHLEGPLWMHEVEFAQRDLDWEIPFTR